MNQPPSEPSRACDLADELRRCQADAEFISGLKSILDEAQRLASVGRAVCLGGGGCCKFDLAGFRLYLSTGEMALLSSQSPPNPANIAKGRCPYQVGPRCMARNVRPLGCRMHFCRNGHDSPGGNESLYEDMHAKIRRLHDQSGHIYVYRDLLDWFWDY